MGKVKFTKGELKTQRDALRQFQRYLPTLQLKKQQLQLEIVHQINALIERRKENQHTYDAALTWSGLLSEPFNIGECTALSEVVVDRRNIAGVDIPVFKNATFKPREYDLFFTPLWVDSASEALRKLIVLREEMSVLENGLTLLRQELRITTQRVNLFEKVKIPEAKEAIRKIKIYLGDQTTNAVGRSKIAKKKIENLVLEGVSA